MRRLVFTAILLSGFSLMLPAQQKPYTLDQQTYLSQIKTNPDKRLIEISKAIPDIILDIRYATTNNFTHHIMYKQARAFVRAPVVNALQQIQAALKPMGLGLKVFDAYRPYTVTVTFYELIKDTNFVADPRYGSRHNRGCAVDLTLADLKTGKALIMPTEFDSFSPKAAADYKDLSKEQLKNRELLKAVMQVHGFKVLKTEWWHYDFTGWENYELLDVPFNAL